ISPVGDYAGFGRTRVARAVAAGLDHRPIDVTVRDTLAWWRAQPGERRAALKAGLAAKREADLLAAWHARIARGVRLCITPQRNAASENSIAPSRNDTLSACTSGWYSRSHTNCSARRSHQNPAMAASTMRPSPVSLRSAGIAKQSRATAPNTHTSCALAI